MAAEAGADAEDAVLLLRGEGTRIRAGAVPGAGRLQEARPGVGGEAVAEGLLRGLVHPLRLPVGLQA